MQGLYFYRSDAAQITNGVKISFAQSNRVVLFLWGQQNGGGNTMPFGLFVGVSPSGTPQLAYTNLTDKEIVPTWNGSDLSISIPANQYTDMFIISNIYAEVSAY